MLLAVEGEDGEGAADDDVVDGLGVEEGLGVGVGEGEGDGVGVGAASEDVIITSSPVLDVELPV